MLAAAASWFQVSFRAASSLIHYLIDLNRTCITHHDFESIGHTLPNNFFSFSLNQTGFRDIYGAKARSIAVLKCGAKANS